MRVYLNFKPRRNEACRWGVRGRVPSAPRSLADGRSGPSLRAALRFLPPARPFPGHTSRPRPEAAPSSVPAAPGPARPAPPPEPPEASPRQPATSGARLRLRAARLPRMPHAPPGMLGVVVSRPLPHGRGKALGPVRLGSALAAALPLTCPGGRLSSLLIGSLTQALPFWLVGRRRSPREGAQVRVAMAAKDAGRPGAEGSSRALHPASARDGRRWVLALQPGRRIAVPTGDPSSSREAGGDGEGGPGLFSPAEGHGGAVWSMCVPEGGRRRRRRRHLPRGWASPCGVAVSPAAAAFRLPWSLPEPRWSRWGHPCTGVWRRGGGGARRSAACPRLPSGLWVAPQGWAGCGAGWGPAALRGGRPFPLTGVGPIAASEVEGPGPCLWALWTGGTLSVSLAFTDCKVLFIELPYLP